MMDLFRKVLYTGIGLATLTEQKIGEMVGDLEKHGEVSAEEGKKLAAELVDKAKQHSEQLQKMVSTEVNKAIEKVKGVSRADFLALQQRVADLEARAAAAGQDSL